MATSPQYPEPPQRDQKPRDVHPKLRTMKKSRVPWPVLIIIVAALILAGFIYWLPRSPKAPRTPSAAQVPAQPNGSQIQLTNVKVVPDVTKGSAYVEARLENAGSTDINGIEVDATFKALNGQNLETERAKVMGLLPNSGNQTVDLTQQPIKPGEFRPVRINFDRVPQGWNQQVPEIKVVTVTGTGK